ncbi:SRPBCC family protein [Streptomyces sp. SCUT-3]|uniref:SRPBCC family protein n=1 Tax=Streptomyces TaxID=1883 RepID=UPI000CAD4696|nr:SRPBCC family protein [Streptomyces sp. SCUT-3]PLW71068.1 SRPBCC family protein [Streptomyces sp. DJ]QMV20512.1 SRPBCC family protein [Streptomyces sp. SCUT-3]
MHPRVSESTEVAVPPRVVYDAVADVGAMGRWSPECTGADVEGTGAGGTGSPEVRVGTRFAGRNASGRVRRWSTDCTVTAAVPGERFAFLVRAAGLRVAVWEYRFEPADSGRATVVTETWTDQRGRLMHVVGRLVTGVRDRAAHNRATMKVTLRRLKEELEREHRPS